MKALPAFSIPPLPDVHVVARELRRRYPDVRIVSVKQGPTWDGVLQQSVWFQAPPEVLRRHGLLTDRMVTDEEFLRLLRRRKAAADRRRGPRPVHVTANGDVFGLSSSGGFGDSRPGCWDLLIYTGMHPRPPGKRTSVREAQRVLKRIAKAAKAVSKTEPTAQHRTRRPYRDGGKTEHPLGWAGVLFHGDVQGAHMAANKKAASTTSARIRGRPPLVAEGPDWFNVERYSDAASMDAADWYLNLALRSAIASGHSQKQFLLSVVRGVTPLLLRNDLVTASWLGSWIRSHRVLVARGFLQILEGKEPPRGVEYLRVPALYYFEKQLSPEIRAFGATYEHGKTPLHAAPAGFIGPLDHALTPRQLHVFARIDMALPNDVLLREMSDFLANVRREFGAIGGPQPYKEALVRLGKSKRGKLLKQDDHRRNEAEDPDRLKAVLRQYPILQVIDLDEWYEDAGGPPPGPAPMARLFKNVDEKHITATREYADRLLNGFVLSGWLLHQARDALRIKDRK